MFKYVCSLCHKNFAHKKNYNYHIKNKVCDKLYKCTKCSYETKNKISYENHVCDIKNNTEDIFCDKDSNEDNNVSDHNFDETVQKSNILSYLLSDMITIKKNINFLQKDINMLKKENLKLIESNEELKKKLKQFESSQNKNNNVQNTTDEEEKQVILKNNENIDYKNTCNSNNNSNNNNNNKYIINDNIQVITQNIKLVQCGKEDYKKISVNKIVNCLNDGLKAPISLTELINFNVDYPEYHNMYISNSKTLNVHMYDGERWNIHDLNYFTEFLFAKRMEIISEMMLKQKLMEYIKPWPRQGLNKLSLVELDSKDETYANFKKSIKEMLINKKHMALNTIKANQVSNICLK